jgi:hypothetical protein
MVKCSQFCCQEPGSGCRHSLPPAFRTFYSRNGALREHATLAAMVEKVDRDASKTSVVEAAASVLAKLLSDASFAKSPGGLALAASAKCLTLGMDLNLFYEPTSDKPTELG